MDLRDNEMRRSVTQSLYKYLPDSWGDFYIKGTRTEYIAKIKRWNSEKLVDINKDRVIDKVKECIFSFEECGGNLNGFGEERYITSEYYDVLAPKTGINEGAIAEISPLVFFCSQCSKVKVFYNSMQVNKTKKEVCACGGSLIQIPFIYSCECGWDAPVTIKKCKTHGIDYMKYDGKFKFYCAKCNYISDMVTWCEHCKERKQPSNALDGSNFIPFSFSIIDLIENRDEKFLRQYRENAAKVIIANWLNQLDSSEYKQFLDRGIEENVDLRQDPEFIRMKAALVAAGIDPISAEKAALATRGNGQDKFEEIKNYIRNNINIKNENRLIKCASSILEYQSIVGDIESKIAKNDVKDIEYAQSISKHLNTTAGNVNLCEMTNSLGITKMFATSNVPLVFCSYGYTRKKNDPSSANGKLTLRAFEPESKKKNVFGVKLLTEGIVMEFDRRKILEWLVANNIISVNELPVSLDDEVALKEWFLNNIDTSNISPFKSLEDDPLINRATVKVYSLLHSIAHAFIKEAGQLCGLDKNSLSEFIFAEIPSIFIYCQNSQGLNLGALTNLFEAYLDKWIKYTLESIQKCIFDPICIDRDKACSGCLFLNEVSCTHFNKDLDRRLLIGHFDKINECKTIGFWEKALWQ